MLTRNDWEIRFWPQVSFPTPARLFWCFWTYVTLTRVSEKSSQCSRQ